MKLGALLVAVLMVGVVATPAQGGGICHARTYGYSYYAPTYYAPTYYAPTHYEQPLAVVKAYYSPDLYSSVQDYYRDKVLVDAVAGKALELVGLKAELQAIRQQLEQARTGQGGAPQPPVPQRQPTVPAQPQQQTMPRAASGKYGAVPPELPPIVKQNCLSCHGATFATKGGNLDLRDLEAIDSETRLQCYAAVVTGEMPRGREPLPKSAHAPFAQWYGNARALRAQARRER